MPAITFKQYKVPVTLLSIAFCLLTSCGGGGGNEAPSAQPQPPSQPQPTPPPCTEQCEQVRINEAAPLNSIFDDDDGDSPDWIELYNFGDSGVSLDGWTISDDLSEPFKWTFPDYTLQSGDHLVVWASDKDRYDVGQQVFHTNFKISSDGETVYLFDAQGNMIHSLLVQGVPTGNSTGVDSTGEGPVFFDTPTPGETNTSSTYSGYVESTVIFSHDGGTLNGQAVTLSGATEGQVIRYTLDSTIPTQNSTAYTAPIQVDEDTVIRARIFQTDHISSSTETRTYIVSTTHNLPVVTLVTEPANFFDEDTGIYAYGSSYENSFPYNGANFWQDWERDIHFSFYDPDGTLGVALDAGVKIFGGWSRGNDQRSLSIFARGRYGFSEIDYPLFPDLSYSSFQAVVLRNSGNDWNNTMLRDAAMTGLMAGSGLEVQAYRPVATYLNGEYWGMYNLREKVNEHFLASKYDLDPDVIDLLEGNGVVVEGDYLDYDELINFIETNNLAEAGNYDYVSNKIDIDNFTIYQIAQIYFNNTDWPGNNIKYWRAPGRKWRWILYDTDFGFGIYDPVDYQNNTLAFAVAPDNTSWPNPSWSTLILRKLLENETFRSQFINRFADEINSRFLPARVSAHIDSMADVIASEIPLHMDRWSSGTLWESKIDEMKNWGSNRPDFMMGHIQNHFSLADIHTLTVNNDTPSRGTVTLNSLTLDTASWSGDYFEGVPVTLTAVPGAGYVFSNWTGASTSNDASIQVSLTSSTVIAPVFVAAQ